TSSRQQPRLRPQGHPFHGHRVTHPTSCAAALAQESRAPRWRGPSALTSADDPRAGVAAAQRADGTTMLFESFLDRFAEKSPVTVMTRAVLEYALNPKALDAVFGKHAVKQYQSKLLFSSVVDVMSLAVCRVQPSVKTAYEAMKDTLPVTLK